MNQELNCPRCFQAFDNQDRTPQMLPKCGHSMCMKCLKEQQRIVCPEDGILQPLDLALYPVNQTILKILNRSSYKNSQIDSTELGDTLRLSKCDNFFEVIDPNYMCLEHHKKIELVCLDDFYKICVNCALFGNHKHHNVRNIDDVVEEIQQNLEESVQLMQQLQTKVKSIKQPLINKKIRDQIRICIKQQQSQAEEQFKEIITQIMLKQRKMMEEIEQSYKQIEDQLIKREQNLVNQILEKADLWMLATQEKINQFASTTEKGEIAFFLLPKDTSSQTAHQIIEELDEFMKNFQSRMSEINIPQSQIKLGKDLLGNIECNYPQVQIQQSFFHNDDNILRDVSMIDQSFLKEIDDKPPHNEFLVPSILHPINMSDEKQQSQKSSSTIQLSHSTSAVNNIQKRQPSQHEFTQSPKLLKRQQSMSPKRPQKKKLNDKASLILLNPNVDSIDLTAQDLGDDGLIVVEEMLRNRKLKILKLMRDKISDTGAAKLLELNVQTLYLQSNVITERFLDILIQTIVKGVTVYIKFIYLNQNLMNQFRVKKKIEELKKHGISVYL